MLPAQLATSTAPRAQLLSIVWVILLVLFHEARAIKIPSPKAMARWPSKSVTGAFGSGGQTELKPANSGPKAGASTDFGQYDTTGMPAVIIRALSIVLNPDWSLAASSKVGERCVGHIFVTANGSFGANDRLRGLVEGAFVAAASQRQLHVDPSILGDLGQSTEEAIQALLESQARLQRSSGCRPWRTARHIIHNSHTDMFVCRKQSTLARVLKATAAVVVLDSNCYSFRGFNLSLAHSPDISRAARETASDIAFCKRSYSVAELDTTTSKLDQSIRGHVLDARELCILRKENILWPPGTLNSTTIDLGQAQARFGCRLLPQHARCAAAIFHAAWATRRVSSYRAVMKAARLQRTWQSMFAPSGLIVQHMRTTSTQLSVDTCSLPSVPWDDQPTGTYDWGSGAQLASWLQDRKPKNFVRTKTAIAVLSDSGRAALQLSIKLPAGTRVVACGSQSVHVGMLSDSDRHRVGAQPALKLLFDLSTIARSQVTVYGSGMMWMLGIHWLSWRQGPVTAPAQHNSLVPGAAEIIHTALHSDLSNL